MVQNPNEETFASLLRIDALIFDEGGIGFLAKHFPNLCLIKLIFVHQQEQSNLLGIEVDKAIFNKIKQAGFQR